MHVRKPVWIAALGCAAAVAATGALAQNVKVTPLGGFDGEFCAGDRALVSRIPTARASYTIRAAR